MDHHIFLSYSRADTVMMQRLRDDLRGSGFTVWTDESIEPGSASWKMDIEKAIREAGCLVVLLSPDAAESKWVRAEIDFAESLQKPLYTLLVRGEKTNAVPFGLTTHQRIDLRDSHQYASGLQMLTSAINNQFNLSVTGISEESVAKLTPVTGRRFPLRLVISLVALLVLIGVVAVWLTGNPPIAPSLATQSSQTTPGEWVRQQAGNISLAVPPKWALGISGTPSPESLSVLYSVFDEVASNPQAAEAFKAAFPAEAYKLIFGNWATYLSGAVVEQDLPIAVSLDVVRLRARTLLEGLNVTITEDSIVSLPIGDMLRVRVDAQMVSGLGESVQYFLPLERKLYTVYFLIGLTDSVNKDVEPIISEIDAIMQTFKIES